MFALLLSGLPLGGYATAQPPCSLNGDLVNGRCHCDPQWQGEDCERLNLLPARPDAGLQTAGEFGVFSSWGGSVAHDGKDYFHMFAAVMEHGCGLNAWRPNSAIGHAISKTAEGPYELVGIIKPHFAHSPEVVRGIDGAWLVYHVGAGGNDTRTCPDPSSPKCQFATNCSRGCTGPDHPFLGGTNFYGPAAVLRAESPWGPWESKVLINGTCGEVPGCMPNKTYQGNGNDMNPAPFIQPDGSVKMLWRSIDYPSKGGSYYAAASAPAWDGPFTWSTSNIFPDFGWCHIEDGHLFKNRRGWHALFHSDCEPVANVTGGPRKAGGAAGGHAYSADGIHWTFHPKLAYDNNITLADGRNWTLNRRERPKLIMDAAGNITHLINGISLPGAANGCLHPANPFHGGGDHTFTFVQPINQVAGGARDMPLEMTIVT